MKKVLVIAAHPDDEVLGCGGTIARHCDENDEVHIIFMADGVTSRMYDPHKKISREQELEAYKEEINKRQDETLKASEILSVDRANIYFLNFPDQRLDSVPLLDLIKGIEGIKSKISPDIIYTHFFNDLNLDHCLTARATLTAFRPVMGVQTPIYHFEVPESTSLSIDNGSQRFVPEHFVEISKTMDRKIEALRAYESEQREFPHLRSLEYIRKHAIKKGVRGGQRNMSKLFIQINQMEAKTNDN